MSKLLRAGFRRYTRNILFWIGIVLSIGVGFYVGYETSDTSRVDDAYYLIPMFAYAVIVSLMIGREFSDGIFRNKITAGHSKGKIFVSEALLAISVCMLMFLLTSVCFAIMNMRMFKIIPTSVLVLIYVGIFLTTLAFVSLFVLISTSLSTKVISAILSLLLIFGFYFTAYEIVEITRQEEFHYAMEFDPETGKVGLSDELSPNPDYIGGPLRMVFEIADDTLPLGQFIQYADMLYPMFRLENGEVATVSNEDMTTLYTRPLYSLGLIIVLLGSGYIIFRKKDFK